MLARAWCVNRFIGRNFTICRLCEKHTYLIASLTRCSFNWHIMLMDITNQSSFPEPPSFDEVQGKLQQSLFDKVVEAISEGTLHVPEYAKWQAESIDYALAPNLVRHKAKQYLISQGQETNNEEEVDNAAFRCEIVSNNGLYIKAPEFRVRILKSSEDGNVPLPGESEARKNFYNQDQATFDFARPVWNLIVHWTVDREYNLLKLSVALPLRLTKNDMGQKIVECAFDEPFWRRPPLSNVVPINDVPAPPVASLDIDLQEETGEKTGEGPKGE
jgi:hypothetical protein